MKTILFVCSFLLVSSLAHAQGDGDAVLAQQRAILLSGGGGFGYPVAQAIYEAPVYNNPVLGPGFYGGYVDPYFYFFVSPCRAFMPSIERPIACVQSAITFKVEDSWLEKATLRIDGYTVGAVGNFRTRHILPDRKLYLGADKEHVIQITRFTEDHHTQVWIDRVKPETIRMMNGRAIEILVSEEAFQNAPYSLDVTPSAPEQLTGKEHIMGKKP